MNRLSRACNADLLIEQPDQIESGTEAVLVVADAGGPKEGMLPVGETPQHCGKDGLHRYEAVARSAFAYLYHLRPKGIAYRKKL